MNKEKLISTGEPRATKEQVTKILDGLERVDYLNLLYICGKKDFHEMIDFFVGQEFSQVNDEIVPNVVEFRETNSVERITKNIKDSFIELSEIKVSASEGLEIDIYWKRLKIVLQIAYDSLDQLTDPKRGLDHEVMRIDKEKKIIMGLQLLLERNGYYD